MDVRVRHPHLQQACAPDQPDDPRLYLAQAGMVRVPRAPRRATDEVHVLQAELSRKEHNERPEAILDSRVHLAAFNPLIVVPLGRDVAHIDGHNRPGGLCSTTWCRGGLCSTAERLTPPTSGHERERLCGRASRLEPKWLRKALLAGAPVRPSRLARHLSHIAFELPFRCFEFAFALLWFALSVLCVAVAAVELHLMCCYAVL